MELPTETWGWGCAWVTQDWAHVLLQPHPQVSQTPGRAGVHPAPEGAPGWTPPGGLQRLSHLRRRWAHYPGDGSMGTPSRGPLWGRRGCLLSWSHLPGLGLPLGYTCPCIVTTCKDYVCTPMVDPYVRMVSCYAITSHREVIA